MSDDTPPTGAPMPAPAGDAEDLKATVPASAKPTSDQASTLPMNLNTGDQASTLPMNLNTSDHAATLPMNLNAGHGDADPLAGATVAMNLNVTHPTALDETRPTAAPRAAATGSPASPPSPVKGDSQDLQATIPTRGDAQDLQGTVPASKAAPSELAKTVPIFGAAPGAKAADDRTLAMDLNRGPSAQATPRAPVATQTHATSQPPALGDAPTLATVPMSGDAASSASSATAATLATMKMGDRPAGPVGDAPTLATMKMGEASAFSGSSPSLSGSQGPRTGSFTQRIGRTKLNASLPTEQQHLDTKLQLSRPSVLADMAAAKGAGNLPRGIQKLIDEQGTEGRYAINRELAHGGMGAVLDISDHDFRRKAAMKVILGRFANSPEAMERFLAEAQVTAQLEHPNIVPIHDMGVMEDGTLYFTMKMIEGQSLGKVVKLLQQQAGKLMKEGKNVPPDAESKAAAERWTIEEKIHVFLKVLDGVGFAHSRGVIHRDIKPDNIMLGGHGEVLVVDWGIAKVLASADQASALVKEVVSIRDQQSVSATMAGSAMGTIFYMPPEQAQGELQNIDATSDVYALGATLYELLSLRRCLDGTSIPEMIVKIVHGEIVPLDQADPTLHPDLVAIIHRSMARERSRRYASCEAFAEDLRRYLAGQAVEARKRSIGELIRLWIAQNKLKLQLGAAGVVLVAGAIAGTWWYLAKEHRAKADQLFNEAKITYAALGATPQPDDLVKVSLLVSRAMDLEPSDRAIQAFDSEVSGAAKLAKKRFDDEEVVRRNRQAAHDLFTRGQDEAKKDAVAGLATLQQALKLTPEDTEIQAAVMETQKIASNKQLEEKTRVATGHFDASSTALAAAAAKDPLDAQATELLKQAEAELVLADQDHDVKLPGVAGLVKKLDEGRARVAAAAKAADNLKRARELSAKAAASLDAADPDDAMKSAEQAIGFASDDADTKAMYARATLEKQRIEFQRGEVKRRQEAETNAAKLLEGARKAQAEMNAQRDIYLGKRQEAEVLGKKLADKPIADKSPVFAAIQASEQARKALVQEWANCEGLANNVVATLEPFAGADKKPQAYREGLSILAQLYHNRLVEAQATRNLPEIEAFRNLLARADRLDHTYAAELAGTARLKVTGKPGAVVMARRVVVQPDTRLAADGEPMPIEPGKDYDLASGTWQLQAADTIVSLVLRSDQPTVFAWPENLKSVPGIPLRFVPGNLHVPVGGEPPLKPFMLGVNEITIAQYLAFVKEESLPAIKKIYKDFAKSHANGENPQPPPYPHLPMNQAFIPKQVKFETAKDETEIRDISVMPGVPMDSPVISITREDARDFCVWLSKKNGVKARLPLKSEWQFAACGDDIQRVYPWGGHFDANFTCSSAAKLVEVAAKVGSVSYDVGPFGHFDLAGNVREWLGDDGRSNQDPRAAGAHHALIAGGAYSDDDEHWFRSTYSESVDDAIRAEMIGFRILVELP